MLKNKIKKDKKTRFFVKKNELNNILFKYINNNNNLNKKIKIYMFFKYLKHFHLNSSSTRIVNTCLRSGRSHWIIRRFRLARMSFKTYVEKGILTGVRRATW